VNSSETTLVSYVYGAALRKTVETVNYGPFEKSYSYTYYKNGFKKSVTMGRISLFQWTFREWGV